MLVQSCVASWCAGMAMMFATYEESWGGRFPPHMPTWRLCPWHTSHLCGITTKTKDNSKAIELLWRKFFAEPSCWWDKRFNKRRKRCPDFVHCNTKEALWVDSWLNPLWVEQHLKNLEHHCNGLQVRAKYALNRNPNCSMLGRSSEATTPLSSFAGVRKLCETGHLQEAILATEKMQQQGISVSNNIFFYLLRECIYNEDIAAGRQVYTLIVKGGLESSTYLGSQLIEMYTSFGNLSEANEVSRKLFAPNLFAWSAIILANVKLGHAERAIVLYEQMILSTLQADGHLFVAILKACTELASLVSGKVVHVRILSCGLKKDAYLGNALTSMYAKCGCLWRARLEFEKLPQRDLVAWTAMITGYTKQERGQEALQLALRMHAEGIEPDDITFSCILKACVSTGAEDYGDLIYAYILENAQELGSFAGSTLISFYFKCRRPDDACKVFDVVSDRCTGVAWNAMIAGIALHGHIEEVLCLFQRMQTRGLEPDKATFVSVLSAQLGLNQAKEITECIAKSGFESDAVVGSALLHVLSNRGGVEDACRVFDKVLEKDVVTWSTMVACYAHHGCNYEALSSLQKMQQDGLQPNSITFVGGLKACTNVADLYQGKLVHHNAIENSCESDLFVGSVLIDMYVKCKSLEDSHAVFERMPLRDAVAWNGIIRGYGQLSGPSELLQLFCSMQSQGVTPNNVTFSSILSAGSSIGTKESSYQTFQYMQAYGNMLTLDLYNCIADFFGRSGDLKKSDDLLNVIPYAHNMVGWRSLLSHCRTHENVELGLQCFDIVASVEGNQSAGYTLMSNLYNRAGMWEDARKIEVMRNFANAWKLPGKASVLVLNRLNDFAIADKSHPQSDEVFVKLNRLFDNMRLEGYLPASDMSSANLTGCSASAPEGFALDKQALPAQMAAG